MGTEIEEGYPRYTAPLIIMAPSRPTAVRLSIILHVMSLEPVERDKIKFSQDSLECQPSSVIELCVPLYGHEIIDLGRECVDVFYGYSAVRKPSLIGGTK
jgi:hypothetical protein